MASKSKKPTLNSAPGDTPTSSPDESSATKFKRIASDRVSKILDAMSVLAKLGNGSTYERSDEQVEVIVKTLHAKVDAVAASLLARKNTTEKVKAFTLE